MGQYYEAFNRPFFLSTSSGFNTLDVNNHAYERDDAAIVNDLHRRLAQLDGIDTSQLKTSAKAGIVKLEGHAASSQVSQFLARVADHVLGVREVINLVEISRAGASNKEFLHRESTPRGSTNVPPPEVESV